MRRVSFLTSMELILTPNCNILHSHANDMNSLKSCFLGGKRLQL